MKKIITLTACLYLFFNAVSFSQAGSLDTTFGKHKDGFVTIQPVAGQPAEANAMAIQPDGKIILAGYSRTALPSIVFTLVRYTYNGLIDRSFGTNGIILDSPYGAKEIALQSDNKIVVLGGYDSRHALLIRFTSTGKIDSSFSRDGRVYTEVSDALAIEADGKILVGGNYPSSLILRYNTNGSLDTSFGNGGSIPIDFSIKTLLIQPDQKIIAAGGSFTVARYLSNGKVDKSFGQKGRVTTDFNGASCTDAALQADGKIVVAGTVYGITKYSDFALVRYLASGQVDSSFGENGKVSTEFLYNAQPCRDYAAAVAIQKNGKIVVTGHSRCPATTSDFISLARYFRGNGSLDNVFGVNGRVLAAFTTGSWPNSGGNDVAIDSAGKILVAGTYGVEYDGPDPQMGLARFNNDSATGGPQAIIAGDDLQLQNFIISPNPVKDVLYIQGLFAHGKKIISVFNSYGKLFFNATTQGTTYSFKVNQLTPGMYYVKIDQGANITTLKFIKE